MFDMPTSRILLSHFLQRTFVFYLAPMTIPYSILQHTVILNEYGILVIWMSRFHSTSHSLKPKCFSSIRRPTTLDVIIPLEHASILGATSIAYIARSEPQVFGRLSMKARRSFVNNYHRRYTSPDRPVMHNVSFAGCRRPAMSLKLTYHMSERGTSYLRTRLEVVICLERPRENVGPIIGIPPNTISQHRPQILLSNSGQDSSYLVRARKLPFPSPVPM